MKTVARMNQISACGIYWIGAICVACSMLVDCDRARPDGEIASRGANTAKNPMLEKFAALTSGATAATTEAAVAKMATEVINAGEARDEDSAIEYIVDRYRDSELGVAAVQVNLERLLKKDADQAVRYSREILRVHGNAPTAACALDFLLDRLRSSGRDEYLTVCREFIGGTAHRLKRVALLSRINFYDQEAEPKLAALDSLLFWGIYPDFMQSHHLKPFFCGILERAGWLLEADVMRDERSSSQEANLLFDYLTKVSVGEALETGHITNRMQGLYVQAPDVRRILKDGIEGLSSEDRATVLVYCARLELARAADTQVPEMINQYQRAIQSLLEEGGNGLHLRLLNQGMCRAIFDYVRLCGEAKDAVLKTRGARNLAQLDLSLDELARIQALLCRDELDPPGASDCSVDALSKFFDEINVPRVNAELLESFTASHPMTPETVALRIKLGQLQRERLEQPQKAVETYMTIFREDPEGAQSGRAALLGCIVLVEEGQREEALGYLRQVKTVLRKEDPDYPLALYLMAICEHASGDAEAAEARVSGMLLDYPQSPISAKALLWLGSTKLAEQDYQKAAFYFEYLIDHYPESLEAKNAKEYVERLSTLSLISP